MEEYIDKLQDAHCQLLGKFRNYIHPIGQGVQQDVETNDAHDVDSRI
jgi:hypothetical protein